MSLEVSESYRRYVADLTAGLWAYRERRFGERPHLFDGHRRPRPPVFANGEVRWNVLARPGADEAERERIWEEALRGRPHRWLGSMKSSQALAASVFANLKVYGKLELLADLRDDDGLPLFPPQFVQREHVHLEHEVSYLGEPRPTSVDVLFGDLCDNAAYRVAVECKLSEAEVGSCSRPNLRPERDPSYASSHCDETYTRQRGRRERCSLSEIGVAYWRHVPKLFTWSAESDLRPCPLRATYQLVRNVLAACVRPARIADPASGHAVLLYDARNPQFGPGGSGFVASQEVRASLRDPSHLRLGTWQQITRAIGRDGEMAWLAEALGDKYGL